jgi:hypothetical protein
MLAPDEPGSWGPLWEPDELGALQPEITLFPFATAELWADVTVMLGSGTDVGWSEGPFVPLSDAPISVPIKLPSEIDETLAMVRVLVTAIHPDSGLPIGHRSARAFAYRQDGTVRLVSPEEVASVAVMPAARSDGLVEDGFIGREVTP